MVWCITHKGKVVSCSKTKAEARRHAKNLRDTWHYKNIQVVKRKHPYMQKPRLS